MSFWSGEKLLLNRHIVVPFDENQLDCNAYVICMGDVYFRTAEADGELKSKTTLKDGETFVIPAGQFGYLLSAEEVNLPIDTMGFLSMRTKFKYQGLINVSGFHVDPGYAGKLVFAVYNAGPLPVHISRGERVFKIWFAELDRRTKMSFPSKGIYDIDNELVRGMSKEILSLQSLSDQMRDLKVAVDARFSEQKPTIDNLNQVWRTVTLGVTGAIIIAIWSIVMTFTIPTVLEAGRDLAKFYRNPGIVQKTMPSPLSTTGPSTPETPGGSAPHPRP